jgi:hypothetical protein
VRRRLSESALRIAVGGRLKAGKSTLVNALLGQRLAATAVTECTLIVVWSRYAPQNRVEVRAVSAIAALEGLAACEQSFLLRGREPSLVPHQATFALSTMRRSRSS